MLPKAPVSQQRNQRGGHRVAGGNESTNTAFQNRWVQQKQSSKRGVYSSTALISRNKKSLK